MAQPGPPVTLVVVSTAVGEFGQIVYAIGTVSVCQRLCPDAIPGRVNATLRFVIMGPFPAGAVVGSALGDAIGLRATVWVPLGLVAPSAVPLLAVLRRGRDVDALPAWHLPDR